jgi:hypothetical protein
MSLGNQRYGCILNVMRYREITTPGPVYSEAVAIHIPSGASNPSGYTPPSFPVMISYMWDNPQGNRHSFKECLHLSYDITQVASPYEVYNGSDFSNAPNPNVKFTGWHRGAAYLSHRPSTNSGLAGAYIPVSSRTTNDIDDCVFKAWNSYVNGVRSLDGSVSIAELGETPGLFRLWQRRLSAPHNLVNGFLNYSFGWRPLISDLRAIARELRSFPSTVRKRLKSLGKGFVTRHYAFDYSDTIQDLNVVIAEEDNSYDWADYKAETKTTYKRRKVVVTIRAKVEPKLDGFGQDILNKLGPLGLIPSIATIWAVTRLSFVIDWFYNIGGAIENLQGSLTHNISDVSVCVSDSRERILTTTDTSTGSPGGLQLGVERQRYYRRIPTTVPLLPQLTYPRRYMPYILLSMLGLTTTRPGKKFLKQFDDARRYFPGEPDLPKKKGK